MSRWLAFALILMMPSLVSADELRPGYLELNQTGPQSWAFLWKMPGNLRIPPNADWTLPEGCRLSEDALRRDGRNFWRTSSMTCTGPIEGQQIGLRALAGSGTDILLRLTSLENDTLMLRLTPSAPVISVPAADSQGAILISYFWIGVEHIAFGFDHLLFVIAMVLLLQRGWVVVQAVTAFTVAHSITLAAVTLGWVGLPQQPVEAVIALSILFLAVEVAKRDPDRPRLSERRPWLVAGSFGLLHGFGFAGALAEIGLPQDAIAPALLAFNIGVEAGQLAVVLVMIMLLWLLRRISAVIIPPALQAMAYGIGITASLWLIERI